MSGLYLNPREVSRLVDKLKGLAGDPEVAHAEEDALWEDVLVDIRDGAPNPSELARQVLRSRDIGFPRWMS